MGVQYTYLATDLRTNTVLGELPVNNVSLDCQLNNAGNMSAGGKLSDSRISDDDFIARTIPGRTAFWAYRENDIVWGGIVLSREYQSSGKSLTLTGQTFECYAAKRWPRKVIGTATQTYNVGGCLAMNILWDQLQTLTSIGVQPAVLPPVDSASMLLTINGYDLSKSYDDLISQVVATTDVDWTIGWSEDGSGLPIKQLIVGLPIGRTLDLTNLVADYPGGIVNYTYTENASDGVNGEWLVGDGDPSQAPAQYAQNASSVFSGFPIFESVTNVSGVTSQATINGLAARLQASGQMQMPHVTHALQLFSTAQVPFGTYDIGDYGQFNIVDPRFPNGQQFSVRVVGWTIQPPDEGQGVELITPVLSELTP